MATNAREAYAWFWRVRRDILALEYVSKDGNWEKLARLLWKPEPHTPTWPHTRPDRPTDDPPHPLPADEELEETMRKVRVLLEVLDYPGDPGDPPLPPGF